MTLTGKRCWPAGPTTLESNGPCNKLAGPKIVNNNVTQSLTLKQNLLGTRRVSKSEKLDVKLKTWRPNQKMKWHIHS